MSKWIVDESNTNIINADHITHIYFEDSPNKMYRLVAETESHEFVLMEDGNEKIVREGFWGILDNLNS